MRLKNLLVCIGLKNEKDIFCKGADIFAEGHKERSLYAVTGKINDLTKLYTGKSSEADEVQVANSQNYPCFDMCTENYVWLWGFSGAAHQTSRNYLHRAEAHVKKL